MFFTRYRSVKLLNNRYILSRYYLISVAKRLGVFKDFNYCFSHSGRYSAFVISSDLNHVSLDIERIDRRLPESLKLKLRGVYNDLILPELNIIMIFETLAKLPMINPPVILSKGITDNFPVDITTISNNIFEVSVNDKKVYSKIYTFADFYICVTLEENVFDDCVHY